MSLAARLSRVGERLMTPSARARAEERRREAAAQAAEERRLARIAERRAALLADDPALRAFTADGSSAADLIGRTVDDFTAADASAHNLRLVTDVLEGEGIDYFLVPGRSPLRHVVGVHRRDRKGLLDAMREAYRVSAVYAVKPGPGGVVAVSSAYVDGALDARIKSGLVIRFAEHLLTPDGRCLAGPEYGCDVEFWRDGEAVLAGSDPEEARRRLRVRVPDDALAGALVAPRPNRVADVLPDECRKHATVAVRERHHPTYEPFSHQRSDEVGFPIDAVYTWVDGADPEHAAKRARYREGRSGLASHAANDSRYTDHDELKYSLRSLRMYAPFVRHVYVVTDGQTPSWLDTRAEGVTLVDHRDVFADPGALPVFSSRAIESQLHRIEALSEHFLYLNDDMFVTAPVGAEHFFHPNGIARLAFSPHQIGVGEPILEEAAPNWAGKNARALLQESFGAYIAHKTKHVPTAQLRSVHRELAERYPEELERTARSRFRDPADVAPVTTLYHHYALLTGRGVPGEYRGRYVDIGAEGAGERLTALAEPDEAARYDFLCLNDFDTPPERQEEVGRMVRAFLESRFPFPAPWERAGSSA
ncbi:stealth family protein [Nocardiopsis sp. NRRL B-16309]|uniref:stealth family protein n=1 Tax=Nocardiopsis sp. NRRL B-16309 TaxID=1519494 RepID=UPI0006B01BC3|nr:stealth family protein [Nocardiopsis sp. NRRL B-16309]KOX17034.1 sugar phosphotransferase [Nocardiopsis sp. NRRL B-16309]